MRAKKNSVLCILLGAATALSACSHVPEPATLLDRYPLTAKERTASVDLAIDPAQRSLGPGQLRQIDEVIAVWKRRSDGPLVVSLPQATLATDARDAVAADLGRYFAAIALPAEAIIETAYSGDPSQSAPIVLGFSLYEAVAPQCPTYAQTDLSVAFTGREKRAFGCSVQANIAAVIEDPRDLIRPRGQDAPDADRRSTVLAAYRAAQATSAQRTQGERGVVSEVAQ
ncbi:MAG TPA: hypothetical protein DCZ49_02640 [Hyphomonadaceae bacterium]|nr:hypothetical protein [Hyphomonadaceae bacterium]